MECCAIKKFTVEAYSTENMWYKIVVKLKGEVVDTFLEKTMDGAWRAFEAAGYERVS